MDTFTFISKIIEHSAWPISVIVMCWVLKAPLENLLNRLNKAKHKDTEFNFGSAEQRMPAAAEGKLNVVNALPQDPLGLVGEAEQKIYESLKQLNVEDDAEKVKVLARHHANLIIRNGYAEINYLIFGSQISILRALNVQNDPVEIEFFKSFYDAAKREHSDFYASYSFEKYVNFLKAAGVINTKDGKYFLTVLGRGFLAYLAESGINEIRPY